MEIDSSPLQLNESGVDVGAKQVSRNNSRGVRVVGSRIYDSENGKTCHQCRQKTMDFSAACKNPKNGKPCTIRFCHKCLLNRYGEKAEEVDLLSDWMCPKCKGSCNCSICMKRKGQQPTGLLVHTAKASGFKSVSEMLSKKASHDLEKELVVDLFGEPGKENSLGEIKDLKVEKEKKAKKMKQKKVKEISNGNNVDDTCQNKILKKPKHCKGVSENAVKRNENAEMNPKVEEFVVDLSGEPEKENSLGRNKVENENTKKIMKRRKLKEISNGSNVDGACQKKVSKRPKHCNGNPEDEVKRNENAEMETKVEEHLVDLTGEPQKKTSLDGNKGSKVENVKTKKMKQNKIVEISDGNNVLEACQKKILKRPKHGNGVSDGDVKINENAEMGTKVEELVGDLTGEAQQKNSLGENKGLKVENVKTKKMKQKKLSAMSNGNNVEGGSQKKMLIMPKHCNGVSERNENAEMETKVELNHGVIHIQMDGPLVMDEGDNASAKSKKDVRILQSQKVKEEIPFPLGTEMTKVLDIEFALEDFGNALQFLEFCRVFGKALDVKKGEAGAILRTLIRKRNLRCGQNTLVVEFQIKLLTLIVSESDIESSSLTASNGKHSWLNVLKDLITESNLGLKEFPLGWLNKGISGYNDLDLSKKLILLNFICDEALGTKKLRSYIDDQNAILAEEKKTARSKVAEAREKEKTLKRKLQDEMAKAIITNGATFSISEYDAILSKIKDEAAKAHNELLEVKGTISKGNQCCEAVRIEPEYFDNNGKTFWKFRSCNDEYAFLLQDIKIEGGDSAVVEEKWFAYGDEQKDEVNKYISSRQNRFPKPASVV